MNDADLCLSVSSSCLVEVASIEQLLLFYFRFVFCEQAVAARLLTALVLLARPDACYMTRFYRNKNTFRY